MFRVTYSKENGFTSKERAAEILAFIKKVAHGRGIFVKDERFGDICLIDAPEDQEEKMKVSFRQSEFNGCGLAVLGMEKFDEDNPTLTFQFPTGKDAKAFLDWLSNSGEQGFYEAEEYAQDFDGSHLYFRYHDPGGNVIPVVRLKEGEKG